MESTGLAAPRAQSENRFNFNPTRELLHFFEHRREIGYDEVVSAFIFILSTLPGYQPGNETSRRLVNCLDSKRPLDVNRVLAAVIRSIPIPAILQQRPLTFADVNAFSIVQVGAMVPPAASPQGQVAYDQQVDHPVQVNHPIQANHPAQGPLEVCYENKRLQPPFPPPAPIHGPPLEIPYTGGVCTKCNLNFRWKKTAAHCFNCLANKPTPELVTAIIERARRGLGSCSNCYKPEDRGTDKHCLACHTRQIGKSQRHQAKKRAQRSQAALAALRNFQQGGGQQAGSGVAAAPSVNIPGATGAAGDQSGAGYGGAGAQSYPGYGGAGVQDYPNIGGAGAQRYPGHGGAGAQSYPGHGGAGVQNYPNIGGAGLQNYPNIGGTGAQYYPDFGGAGVQSYPGYGGAGVQNYPNIGGAGLQNYPNIGGTGAQHYPDLGGAGAQSYTGYGGAGAQSYPGYGGAGAQGGIVVNNGGIVNFGGFVNAAPGPHYFATQGHDVHPGGHGVANSGVVNGGNVYGDMDFAFNGDFVVNGGNVANGGNMDNGSNGFPGGNQ